MNLYLQNHAYRYAVEQTMLSLFPGELPTYPLAAPQGAAPAAVSELRRGKTYATAKTRLTWGGKTCNASVRVKTAGLSDGMPLDRALQKALRLSFYRAATEALGQEPPWGAITGVRPVKIPTKAMLGGKSPAVAQAQLRDFYRVSPERVRLAMDCAGASLRAIHSLHSDEISLYIGIPFCPTRCAYCSFVSADVGRSLGLVEPFLVALLREIQALGQLLRKTGQFVRTIYIGGGTPTTLSAPQLTALMAALDGALDLSRCTEYTVEAGRPDTITAEKLAAIRAGGADRVSVNPQSMLDGVLRAMGRAHSAAEVRAAFALVRQAGFPCVNMDLIAGLPTDRPDGFRSSLDQVLALAPENITVHTLALKKGSRLMLEGGALPSAAEVAQMLDYAWSTLRAKGYLPYYLYRQKYMSGSFENVGWCLPGHENLYNLCMMEELHCVLALGGGGVSKLVNPETGHIDRLANPKYPKEYIEHIEETIAAKNRIFLEGS